MSGSAGERRGFGRAALAAAALVAFAAPVAAEEWAVECVCGSVVARCGPSGARSCGEIAPAPGIPAEPALGGSPAVRALVVEPPPATVLVAVAPGFARRLHPHHRGGTREPDPGLRAPWHGEPHAGLWGSGLRPARVGGPGVRHPGSRRARAAGRR